MRRWKIAQCLVGLFAKNTLWIRGINKKYGEVYGMGCSIQSNIWIEMLKTQNIQMALLLQTYVERMRDCSTFYSS